MVKRRGAWPTRWTDEFRPQSASAVASAKSSFTNVTEVPTIIPVKTRRLMRSSLGALFCLALLGTLTAEEIPVLKVMSEETRKELRRARDEHDIPKLIAFLSSDELDFATSCWGPTSVSSLASIHLASIGLPALEALIEATASPDAKTRSSALRAISDIDDPRRRGALIAALRDEDHMVRRNAASLIGWKRIQAPDELVQALGEANPEAAFEVIIYLRALARAGTPSVRPVITPYLNSPEPAIRKSAQDAIREISAQKASP